MERPADHISAECPFMPSTLPFNVNPACDDSSSSDEENENDVNQNKTPLGHPGTEQVLLNLTVPEERITVPIPEDVSPEINDNDHLHFPPAPVNVVPFVPQPNGANYLESNSNPTDYGGKSASIEPWHTPQGRLSPRDTRALRSSAKKTHSSQLPDGSLIFRGRRFLTKKSSFYE